MFRLIDFKIQRMSKNDTVAFLGLNRPDKANALSDEMLLELDQVLIQVGKEKNCRGLFLFGHGKHFCAGADLEWMKKSAKLNYEENKLDAEKLFQVLEKISNLDFITVCLLQGSVYGGALGLATVCDIVVAEEKTKFCLSELKLGLLPAMILPFLRQRINHGHLKALSLLAQPFDEIFAKDIGLVSFIIKENDRKNFIKKMMGSILQLSPNGIQLFKNLWKQLDCTPSHSLAERNFCVEAIAKARTSEEGQKGLQAFFDKKNPPWHFENSDLEKINLEFLEQKNEN